MFCLLCAEAYLGWSEELGRFETREDWIRGSVPFAPDVPLGIVADWLVENGREEDEQWLRVHRSGRLD